MNLLWHGVTRIATKKTENNVSTSVTICQKVFYVYFILEQGLDVVQAHILAQVRLTAIYQQ